MTHTAKHTPGPLTCSCYSPKGDREITFCTLHAAAPAMYEALLGCLKVARAHLYDVLVRHEDHDGKVPKGIAEIDAARMEVERLETALAQAEGR